MNFNAIFWLVVIVFVVARAIKKSVESAAAQQQTETEDETFAATPEEVQDFLQGLGQRQAPGVQAPAAGGAGVARDALAALEGEPRVAAAEQRRVARPAFGEGERARPVATPAPARSPKRPRRPRREEQRKPLTAERPASGRPEAPPVIPGRPGRSGTPLRFALRGRDLRKAIVWAEVLGPPVSLRRSRRPALPPRE